MGEAKQVQHKCQQVCTKYICGLRPQICIAMVLGWHLLAESPSWYILFSGNCKCATLRKKGCVPSKLSTDGAALIYLPCWSSRFPFCYSSILNSEAVSRSNTTRPQSFAKQTSRKRPISRKIVSYIHKPLNRPLLIAGVRGGPCNPSYWEAAI